MVVMVVMVVMAGGLGPARPGRRWQAGVEAPPAAQKSPTALLGA